MLFGWLFAASLAAAFNQVSPDPNRDRVELDPISEWSVERLEDRCVIRRTFGSPENITILELRSIDPWNGGFHLALASDEISSADQEFSVGWLPNGTFITVDKPTFETRDGKQIFVVFKHGIWDSFVWQTKEEMRRYFDEEGPRKFKQSVEGVLIDGASDQPLFLKTGSMDEVIDMRDACIREMLISQGVDPADENRPDSRVVMKNFVGLGTDVIERAPDHLKADHDFDAITFLFYVSAEGRVSSCRLASLPYDRRYEEWACKYLTERARFTFKQGERAQPTFFKLSGR